MSLRGAEGLGWELTWPWGPAAMGFGTASRLGPAQTSFFVGYFRLRVCSPCPARSVRGHSHVPAGYVDTG